jgi:DNA modification methylase
MCGTRGYHAAEVAAGLEQAGFELRGQIIWAKQHFALSRGNYHWQHEPAWYAVRKDRSAHWRGDRTQSTLWQVANLNPFGGGEEAATGHGTQKPIELMRKPILNHLERGGIVYDPFLGSGTTLVAADGLERVCYGMEIDPCYVDMTIGRWQKARGGKAVLAATGCGWEEMRTLRGQDVAATTPRAA